MKDGVRINVKEMVRFSKKLGDTKLLERIYNNAFEDMLDELAALSKNNHEFESRTFLLENSIFVEVQGKKGSVFVPPEIVSYAGAIYDGYEPFEMEEIFGKKLETPVLHPGYKGDPFILNSWYKFKDMLTKEFLTTFIDQYKIALRAV